MHSVIVCEMGRIDYQEAWKLQEELVRMRQKNEINDTLLLLEHDPVFTIGRNGSTENILVSQDELVKEGIQVYEVNRGGDITYHGPGQIVAYPIFDLHDYRKDLHWYTKQLEEVVIQVLNHYQIAAKRVTEHPGVWVGDEKIAALGVGVKRWVTMHGFAFNIDPNFTHFGMIVPCGITDKGVTSLRKGIKRLVTVEEVMPQVLNTFEDIFDLQVIKCSKKEIVRRIEKWNKDLNG